MFIFDKIISDEARRLVDEGRIQAGDRFPELQGVATYYYQKQARNRDYADEEMKQYEQSREAFAKYVCQYARLEAIIENFVRDELRPKKIKTERAALQDAIDGLAQLRATGLNAFNNIYYPPKKTFEERRHIDKNLFLHVMGRETWQQKIVAEYLRQ